jgi:DNA-binding LacI/PurR family transcriptional regulator
MPVDDMAHAAINMLVDMIEKNEAHTEQKIFTSKIVERSSI